MSKFNYNLVDFRIFEGFKRLHDMRLFIWGAAPKGRQIQGTLRRVGIQAAAYCDSDVRKWGMSYDGLTVISPHKLKKIHMDAPQLCIVSCIYQEAELLKTLEELAFDHVLFLSYWGIITACILYGIPLESEGNLPVYDAVWKYQKRCDLRNTGDLIKFLKRTKLNKPGQIWNLQPGKVASKTVEMRLWQAGIPSHHLHELTYPSHLWTDELKDVFEARIQEGLSKGVKIITGVREPLGRDYSAFWQPFTGARAYLMPVFNKNFQEMYEQYISLLYKGYEYKRAYMKESCSDIWRDEFEWFNEEIKKYIGIDVYSYPFNREMGYQIIRRKNVEIFVYKAEKLDSVMPVLGEFLGKDICSAEDANQAEKKAYYLAYKEFRKKVRIPRSYADHYYKNNPYVNHFYTEEEQRMYLSKWKDNIDEQV